MCKLQNDDFLVVVNTEVSEFRIILSFFSLRWCDTRIFNRDSLQVLEKSLWDFIRWIFLNHRGPTPFVIIPDLVSVSGHLDPALNEFKLIKRNYVKITPWHLLFWHKLFCLERINKWWRPYKRNNPSNKNSL